jgi:hypothetical protein
MRQVISASRRASGKELRRLLRTLDTGGYVGPTLMTIGRWLMQ